ncbi:MAG: hypothetical protein APF80_17455 [Alphaproteobacteria bacterium BRH_c36]|nr:MAG: hypothetical protein APF80_17455 [Alphaproteobacteria bacterium BRH_c36]
MKIKYIIDDKGRLLPAEKFLKREAKGWKGTFLQALKECGDTGKQFLKECEQGVGQFARELTNSKPPLKKDPRDRQRPQRRRRR